MRLLAYALILFIPILLVGGTQGQIPEPRFITTEPHLQFSLHCVGGETEWGDEELYALVSYTDEKSTGERNSAGVGCWVGPQFTEVLTWKFVAGISGIVHLNEADPWPNPDDVMDIDPGGDCALTNIAFSDDYGGGWTWNGNNYVYGQYVVNSGGGSGCSGGFGDIGFRFTLIEVQV